MKKPTLLLILLFSGINYADVLYTWDWQFFVKNNNNQLVGGVYIEVYSYDRANETISSSPISSGFTSYSATYNGANAALEMVETNEIPDESISPNITPSIHRMSNYIVLVGNKYIWITHNGSDDITFYYNTDTYSLTTSGSYIEHTPGVGNMYDIKLKNDFDGGAMYISSVYESSIPLAGRTVSRADYTFPHTLTAVPGLYGTDGYKRLWKIWSNSYSTLGQGLTSAADYLDYEARFDREFSLTFQASGSMYVNGSTRSSSWTESVIEQTEFTAYANNYTSDGLDNTFTHWTNLSKFFHRLDNYS